MVDEKLDDRPDVPGHLLMRLSLLERMEVLAAIAGKDRMFRTQADADVTSANFWHRHSVKGASNLPFVRGGGQLLFCHGSICKISDVSREHWGYPL